MENKHKPQSAGVDNTIAVGQKYLMVVDYYSRYIEIAHLTNMTIAQRLGKTKNMFPDEIVTDNGTQFSSYEFRVFAETYGFRHTMPGPYLPKSTGEVERAVRTANTLYSKPRRPVPGIGGLSCNTCASYTDKPMSVGYGTSDTNSDPNTEEKSSKEGSTAD